MVKNYITPDGFKKLMQEQEHLLKVERPEVTRVVTWAASLGDRSENADYQYGKKRLAEIDERLHFLKNQIENAEIVDPTHIKSQKVQFGATVKVEDEDGNQKDYIIVGVDEIDPAKGYISYKSPIGASLIGKEVGDVVEVKTPKKNIEFEIVEIDYRVIDFN